MRRNYIIVARYDGGYCWSVRIKHRNGSTEHYETGSENETDDKMVERLIFALNNLSYMDVGKALNDLAKFYEFVAICDDGTIEIIKED